MVSNMVQDCLRELPMGDVLLKGHVGDLAERFFHHRVNSRFARETVYKETIDAFRNKLDDWQKVVGIWQGEFWGKWVISAARVARYQRNDELKAFVQSAAHELMSLQDSDGCISTYRDPNVFSAAPKEVVLKVTGAARDMWWNIWCRKYTLWGLLEAAELTGDAEILSSAERLADNLIDSLESRGVDIHETGTFKGMPSCSILKPMLILYRMTGRRRFLEFADFIVDGWEREDGRVPNLIVNALGGKPVHLWYPELGGWTKAYEMMSCFDGLLEYYRVTAHKPALEAAEALFRLLVEHESNLPGSVGFNDQFQNAAVYLNCITEPCDAIHFMRMCFELFKLTGKACYMDAFEHTSLNAFLAGIVRDGTWGMRGVRSSGHHLIVHEQAKMKYNHCCVNNVPRGLINLAESCLMTDADGGLVLNQYIPFEADTVLPLAGHVKVSVSDGFLSEGSVGVVVECGKAMKLSLRVPSWSGSVVIGGERHEAASGYCTIDLASGKNVLQLRFSLNPTVKVFPYPGDSEALPAWHRRRYWEGEPVEKLSLMEGVYAVVASGPLMLARSKLIGNTEEEMFGESVLSDGKWKVSLIPEKLSGVMAGFNAQFTSDNGKTLSCRVCDFASAGNVEDNQASLFSIFF